MVQVLRAIDFAMESGLKLKINCVVMRGMNDDELVDFVDWTRDKKLILRFIEYMPFDGNRWNDKKVSLRIFILSFIDFFCQSCVIIVLHMHYLFWYHNKLELIHQ